MSLTTLQYSDRQNPSCASKLVATSTWELVTTAGYRGLGGYLKAAFLLLAAFYDRSLTVYERAVNAWTTCTFFTLWAEHSKKFDKVEQ